MTELKTLNDVPNDGFGEQDYLEEIKIVAIKRYKYWESIIKAPPEMDTLINYMQIYGRMAEIKEFGNLTDKDLK